MLSLLQHSAGVNRLQFCIHPISVTLSTFVGWQATARSCWHTVNRYFKTDFL